MATASLHGLSTHDQASQAMWSDLPENNVRERAATTIQKIVRGISGRQQVKLKLKRKPDVTTLQQSAAEKMSRRWAAQRRESRLGQQPREESKATARWRRTPYR